MSVFFVDNFFQNFVVYWDIVFYRNMMLDMVRTSYAYYFAPRMLAYDQDQGMLVYADEISLLEVA